MESPYAPLSESVAKALADKTYEKRKLAGVEIEKIVVELNLKNNSSQIKKLIEVLTVHYAASADVNRRKGGLIALASTTLGLGKDCELYIKELATPILNCLSDPDLRVRYLATESLYNVIKVARSAIIPMFPEIFASLTRLVTDPEQMVKEGGELLDRLLKDIVTASSQSFDLNAIVPLLRDRVYVKNPFARQFVISWISVLNAVPEINMVVYVSEILDGLFLMLDDQMKEIQRMCETLLAQFLKSIKKDPGSLSTESTINILIGHAQSHNELIKKTAIEWIKEFVQLSGSEMLPYASGIFTAILPCLSGNDSKSAIHLCAVSVNESLLRLITSKENQGENMKKVNMNKIMNVFRQYLSSNSVQTKVAVLKGLQQLFTELPNEMAGEAPTLFPVLLTVLSDNSDDVILPALSVLAEIVNSTHSVSGDENYKNLLKKLLNLFLEDKELLENRGSLIIRQLCVLLNPECIYRTFASIISEDVTNMKFASTIVRSLNMILLTASELFELRNSLRDVTNKKSAELFQCLYKSWAFCPVSTLSLCLLAQCYQHVSELVVKFANIEVTLELLCELDKLVQLIETPIFSSLRLTLVSKANQCSDAQHLAHALYGILMLLPQTDAFNLLRNRLQCVPNYWGQTPLDDKQSLQNQSGINFLVLLQHFDKIQKLHWEQRMSQRKQSVIQWDLTKRND